MSDSSPLAYDPYDPEVIADPYPFYRRLRDEDPVYFVEKWNAWAIARFEDIWDLTQDNDHLSARGGTSPHYLLTKTVPALPNLNHMDPPAQKALRAEVAPWFLPRRVRSLEPAIREIVHEQVGLFLERGEADAPPDIGQVVAARVACIAIGLPPSDSDYILDLVKRFFHREEGVEGMTETGVVAFEEMISYLTRISQERRKYSGPPEGPIDTLLRTRVEGEALSDDLMGQHLILLLAGATETFPKVFSSSLLRLWEHPDQRRELAENPALIPNALRECLRYDTPTQFLMRKVVAPFSFRGKDLHPEEVVMFLWPSGNRDEREFVEPDRFDIHRESPRILTFGNGAHRCLGSHIAEMEGRLLLEEVLRGAPEYEIDAAGIELEGSEFLRGLAKLPLRVGKRAAA